VRTEVVAGLTTFLTMVYIIFVNPDLLSVAGMPKDGVFIATILASIVGTTAHGINGQLSLCLGSGYGP